MGVNPKPNPANGTVDIEYIMGEKPSDQIELSGGWGGNGFNSPKLIANAGPAAEGVYVGTAWNKPSTDATNVAFQKAMADRNHEPDQFCAQAYTGVLVIAEAIKLSGGKGGRDDIKAGFLKLKGLPTPLGTFAFNKDRDGDHGAALQVVKDGKFQIVK